MQRDQVLTEDIVMHVRFGAIDATKFEEEEEEVEEEVLHRFFERSSLSLSPSSICTAVVVAVVAVVAVAADNDVLVKTL